MADQPDPEIVDTETGEVIPENSFPLPVPYAGIAAKPVTPDQRDILTARIPEDDIDILPSGELYISQVRYRRILTEAFGPMGWALQPVSPLIFRDNVMYREYALICEGRFVAQAIGEQAYIPNNPRMSYATAAEAAKSNALVRCCKDLQIASECWDRHFTEDFKDRCCIKEYDKRSGKYLWRRKPIGPAQPTEDGGDEAAVGDGGRRKASGRGGGRGETQTERPSVPTPPARPGPDASPDDKATQMARDTFWRALVSHLKSEGDALKWLDTEYKAMGLKKLTDMTVGQLAALYQKLSEVGQPAPAEPPTMSEMMPKTFGDDAGPDDNVEIVDDDISF